MLVIIISSVCGSTDDRSMATGEDGQRFQLLKCNVCNK